MLGGGTRFLADAPVLFRPDTQNTLPVGDVGRVKLDGNPTTGYTWHYSISDNTVLALVSSDYTAPRPGLVGAGGTYVWNFKALKAGRAAITFKYYRDWEGEASATAQNTVVYNVTVS
jgi:inhibitor of cysteine peptidase